jgi:cobalamin synthase
MKKKKNVGLFAKITNKDKALKIIKDSSIGFFFVAALQAMLGFFIAPSLIIDGILYAVLAAILLKWKSRVAAVFLLLLCGAALVMTVLNKAGEAAKGGNNIFLAIIIFWVAIRAVEATFKLHGKFATKSI